MKRELINYIKSSRGNILLADVEDEKLLKTINENSNIKRCYLLQKSEISSNKTKVINVKKLKKLLDKNKINEIICNYYTYKNVFNAIPGKFYLNGKLYLYGYMTKNEIEEIKEKCSYYTKYIDVIEDMNETLLIIGSIGKKESYDGIFNAIIDAITSLIR